MGSTEEQEIIQKVLNGDLNLFSVLVDQHKDHAFRLALKIVRNEQEAEEVAQDAFLKAYSSLNKFKMDASFSTWLFRIVYNTALTRLRMKKLDIRSLEYNYESEDYSSTNKAVDELARVDQEEVLAKALDMLSADECVLVELYYRNDKDMHEIANIVNISHGNVRVKLSRCRKKLRAYIEDVMHMEMKDIL